MTHTHPYITSPELRHVYAAELNAARRYMREDKSFCFGMESAFWAMQRVSNEYGTVLQLGGRFGNSERTFDNGIGAVRLPLLFNPPAQPILLDTLPIAGRSDTQSAD